MLTLILPHFAFAESSEGTTQPVSSPEVVQQVEAAQQEAIAAEAIVSESEDDLDAAADEAVVEDDVTFDVWEYRVEGNSVLDRSAIEKTVYPFLGPGKTIDDVEGARSALEKTYQDGGYGTVFVDIPEQDVENGVVILNITEGRVGRLAVVGSRYYSLGKIRDGVPALAEGKTPYLPEVQKQVEDLNKGFPGRTVTPVLKPGKAPGLVDVDLNVSDEFPLHGNISIDDRYTVDTTRTRLNAVLRYDNLWQLGHSASVGYVVSPEDRDEVEVFFGIYGLRFPNSNNVLAMYVIQSSSDVTTTADINQIGQGTTIGARFNMPLPTLDKYSHALTLGMDYSDFDETSRLLGVDALNTPISYVTFATTYTGNWQHEKGTTTLTADATFAPRGLGNTNKEFENKRFGARPNFAILKTEVLHRRKLIMDALLQIKLQASIADSPLISNEQYAVGGLDTVRGYLEAQQLADDGYLASLELRSPSLAKYIGDYLNDFHFKAFIEGARLKIQQPLPEQLDRFTLASVGAGINLTAYEGFNAEFLWGMALSDNGAIESGDSRLHFKVGYGF